jgi:hypothetical protein
LGDPIGKGGWGTIYRTRKEGGQTHYALKEIPFEDGDGDDSETHKEVSMLKQVGALCVMALLGNAGVTHRHALEHRLVDAVSFCNGRQGEHTDTAQCNVAHRLVDLALVSFSIRPNTPT